MILWIRLNQSNNTYSGVWFNKRNKKWFSTIQNDGKYVFWYENREEEYVAAKRELYILENLNKDDYELNFEWTEEEISQWKKFFEDNKKKTVKSQYNGIYYNRFNKVWCGFITRNNKRIFSYTHKNETIVARKRDLFIMNNLKDELGLLNFEWDENDVRYWTTYFEFVQSY